MSEATASPLKKKFLLSGFSLLFSLILIFVAGEIVLRLAPGIGIEQADFEQHRRDRPPRFLHYSWAETYSNIGTPDAEKQHTRIAVLGDSFTEGSGVSHRDRFTDQLQFMLNIDPENPPVEIMNFARSGTSTHQQIAQLDEALARKPDLVMQVMCLNDVEDWRRLDNPELLGMLADMLPRKPKGLTGFMAKRSRLARLMYLKKEHRRGGRLLTAYYEKIYDPEYSGWKLFADSAATIRNRCREANAPLVVVLWPLLNRDLHPDRYPFQYCHDRIKKVWGELDVKVFELNEAFDGLDPQRMQAIPGIDPHPSEIAHRIAAEHIWRYLVENGHLPDAYLHKKRSFRGDGTHKRWDIIIENMAGDHFFKEP